MSKMPRVVSAQPRIEARAVAEKQQRRRRWLTRTGWAALGVVPLVLAAWVLLGSSLLAVHEVTVTGTHRLTVAQVERAADVSHNTPLAQVSTTAIARRIKALDAVASVSVTRSWPNGLRVKVVERTPAVAIADGTRWDLLDSTGVHFDTVTTIPTGVVRLQAKATDAAATRSALAVLGTLPAGLRLQVGLVRAPSAGQVLLVLKDNRVVIWGNATEASAKTQAATALLKLPGHVYDVSTPGVVTRR